MTKIIVLADIHIDDYRSDIPGSRLKNYLKLAEIIRDKAKEVNAPWIFLAGDTLNRPVSPPHVLNVAKKFIETLLESGARIAFITGQHDQNVKELENLKDTYLGIFCSDKVFYADHRMLTVDGTHIYFENFTRNEVVDPERQCDVFISHVTLGRQKVDNSKFKLGIFGDIHDRVDIGNMHSVCPPLCIHAHEEPKGIIGILTVGVDPPKFERFEYDPEFKIFPKLEREVHEIKDKEDLSAEDKEVLKILSCESDFFKEINATVDKLGLSEIHRDVDTTNAPEPINLDFKLTEVYARNFKSIEDMHFKFDDLGKIVFISGDNGSGKTSIIEAIFTALLGDRHIDKKEARWAEEKGSVMVGVKLLYKGLEYEICRGKGWTKFIVDGKEVTKANKTALENFIVETLPFLNLVWIFYIRTYEHFFDKDRVGLVKKCFNLEIFDYFYNQGKLLLQSIKKSLSEALDKNNLLKGKHDQIKIQIEKIREELKEYDGVEVGDLANLTETLNTVNSKNLTRAKFQGKLEIYNKQKSDYEKQILSELPTNDELTSWKTKLSSIKQLEQKIRVEKRTSESLSYSMKSLKMVECPNCHTKFQLSGEAIDSLKKKYDESVNKERELELKLQEESKDKVNYTEQELEKLSSLISKQDTFKAQVESITNELKDLAEEIKRCDEELAGYPTEKELREQIFTIERKRLLLKNLLDEETSLKDVISEARSCLATRKDLNRRIDLCEKYIGLFDIKNLNSIPYTLLVKISEYLSTDTIKFKTYTQLANGNLTLDISCEMKVGEEFIDYDSCSHGQKAMMDFFILSRFLDLLDTTGIVAVDEGLSVLQSSNYDEACDMLRGLKAHNVIVTSHQLGFVNYDSTIVCTLSPTGRTQVEVLR